MEIMTQAHRAGKTILLIMKAAMKGTTIVCHSQSDVCKLLHQAKQLGVKINKPITIQEFIKNNQGK